MSPKSYLSTSGGKWRVIYNGNPLCADTTKEKAIEVAKKYKLSITDVWDGDKGEFISLNKENCFNKQN